MCPQGLRARFVANCGQDAELALCCDLWRLARPTCLLAGRDVARLFVSCGLSTRPGAAPIWADLSAPPAPSGDGGAISSRSLLHEVRVCSACAYVRVCAALVGCLFFCFTASRYRSNKVHTHIHIRTQTHTDTRKQSHTHAHTHTHTHIFAGYPLQPRLVVLFGGGRLAEVSKAACVHRVMRLAFVVWV